MDNPQKLATLGTQDTGHRTKTNEAKHNTENYKDEEQQMLDIIICITISIKLKAKQYKKAKTKTTKIQIHINKRK